MENPLKPWLENTFIGHNLVIMESVDSTNNYAKRLLSKNLPNGTVILAKTQSRGRGQQKNYWASPEGGLYYTCTINSQYNNRLTMLTLACGIACHEAIYNLSQLTTSLKWINDIEYNNKKLGGILLEARVRGKKVNIIIGIGINLNTPITALPPDLQASSTSIYEETSLNYDIYQLAALLSNSLEKYFNIYNSKNYNLIKSHWIKNSNVLGRKIKFNNSNRQIEGLIIDLDDQGGLIIQGFDGKEYSSTNNLDIVYM